MQHYVIATQLDSVSQQDRHHSMTGAHCFETCVNTCVCPISVKTCSIVRVKCQVLLLLLLTDIQVHTKSFLSVTGGAVGSSV